MVFDTEKSKKGETRESGKLNMFKGMHPHPYAVTGTVIKKLQ